MSNELLVSNVVALGPRKTRRDDVVGGRGGWGGDGSPCKGRMGYLLGGGNGGGEKIRSRGGRGGE